MKINTALILCAGLGERLKPLTKNFKNLIINKTVFSKSKSYAEKFLNECKNIKFDISGVTGRK